MEGSVREMNHDEKLVTEYKTWKNEEERINTSCIAEAHNVGVEKGIKQNQEEMILNMNNDNLSLDLISKYANLSIDEVKSIINNK